MKKIISILIMLAPLVGFGQDLFFTVNPVGHNRYEFLNFSEVANTTWDFGDGESSDEYSPFHDFDSAGTYKVCLICDTVKYCRQITIEDKVQNPICLFPVPVQNSLTVDLSRIESDIDFVEIYCPEGIRIYLSNRVDKIFTIDLSDEEAGLFTIIVWTNDIPKKKIVQNFQK